MMSDREFLAWSRVRRSGCWRFTLTFGVVGWGLPFALIFAALFAALPRPAGRPAPLGRRVGVERGRKGRGRLAVV
jgi:hypothetical protein